MDRPSCKLLCTVRQDRGPRQFSRWVKRQRSKYTESVLLRADLPALTTEFVCKLGCAAAFSCSHSKLCLRIMPAPVSPRTTPALAGSDDMIKYMEEALRQLEEAQGGVDEQARAQLDKLKQQTASLSSTETRTQQVASTSPITDELVLAGELDKLDRQMQQLESSIANADPATKEMLSTSTSLWLKQQQEAPES